MKVNATPPNPENPPPEHIIPDWRERFLKSLGRPCMLLRGIYWAVISLEAVTIIVGLYGTDSVLFTSALRVFSTDGSCHSRMRLTPLFLFGNILVLLSTALRVQSFRALGRFFTFELYIYEDHRLIVGGPYAIVRHPSYTGLIFSIIGASCTLASGSWLAECGMLETSIGRGIIFIWLSIAAAVIWSLLLRIPGEEFILQAKFGQEWELWAEQVRYWLIPGVY